MRQHKLLTLFLTLIAATIVQSFGMALRGESVIVDAVLAIAGAAVFYLVFERARERVAMLVIACIWILVQLGDYAISSKYALASEIALHALIALFFGFSVFIILRQTFRRRRASSGTRVFGALSGYLIGAVGWANLNAMAYLVVPGAYKFADELSADLADRHGRAALFLYYSFTQMLTIGYSDVTPLAAPATTLSFLEALFGVLYLAVIVSQLIGASPPEQPAKVDSADK
jgi:hypothetical protein